MRWRRAEDILPAFLLLGAAMIVGIGMDLVEIERISRLMERYPERSVRRLFTSREVEHCLSSRRPEESFAARFAAKEALLKALGTGWSAGACWREIEVVRDRRGAPDLKLHGATRELAQRRGVRRAHLTLTHSGESAAALVVLEGGGDPAAETASGG